MKCNKFIEGVAVMALPLWGGIACSYESLSVAETDVVVTAEEPSTDYSAFSTYALIPEVTDLCEAFETDPDLGSSIGLGGGSGLPSGGLNGDCFEVDHSQDELILETLEQQMNDLGYRKIEEGEPEEPDLVMAAGIVARDNWYMGWYWCDPYYGWWYGGCWYPTYSYAYNLPTGAVVVTMASAPEDEGGDPQARWLALMQGLYVSSSEQTVEQRITGSIEQAFEQSPYLADGGEK